MAAPVTRRPTRSTSGAGRTTSGFSTRRRRARCAARPPPSTCTTPRRTIASGSSSRTPGSSCCCATRSTGPHSNGTHLWNAGLEPESDFLTACRAEPERKAAGWADFWHYVGLGRYGEQVQHLYQVFPREQVLLLRYRELRDAPAATLHRACEFLGVRTGVLRAIPRENVNRHLVEDNGVNRVLRGMLRTGGQFGHRFPLPLRLAARGPLLTVLHRKRGHRPVTTPQERAALLPLFADDIALLQDVTGRRYDDWLSVDRHARTA
jgi:hypothetical protein